LYSFYTDIGMLKHWRERRITLNKERWSVIVIIEQKNFVLGYDQWCDRFLTVQRHAMPPDEYAHLCEVRESRFYLDHANYTQKSRTPGRGIDFPCSVFKASMNYRATATGASNVRSIKNEYVFLARFLRILARFGTRSIQFGRLRRALESPRAI